VTVARVGGHGAEAEGKRRAILTLLHGVTRKAGVRPRA
jgi:hypothetical protein